MSDGDKEGGGRDDRTVFRPMGYRAPAAAPEAALPVAAAAPDEPAAAPPAGGRDDRTVFRPGPRAAPARPATVPPANAAPATAAPAAAFDAARGDDRTVFRPNPAGRRTPAPDRSGASAPSPVLGPAPRQAAIQGTELTATGHEPIMRAAAPILLLLGRLRAALLRAQATQLTPQIVEAVQKFEADTRAADVAPADIASGKTLLCATADAILANLPGEESGQAAQSGLTVRFFGASNGPQRFIDEFERLKTDPRTHHALLKLQHACLALGFEGARIAFPPGAPTPEKLRQELYAAIEAGAPKPSDPAVAAHLSPHWEGQALAGHAARLVVPIWAVVGVVGLALFGLYVGLRTVIGYRADTVAAAMVAMNPTTPIAIARSAVVPPPAPPPQTSAQTSQIERLRRVLGPNIAAGMLDVEQTSNQIVLRITDRVSFQPGRTTVLESFKPLMMYVALAIDSEKGPVRITGHSDNRPVANARYASNFELSLERAQAVASLLKQSLSEPGRVDVEGKGADQPIASNDTIEGRNRNRRVEIAIPRRD